MKNYFFQRIIYFSTGGDEAAKKVLKLRKFLLPVLPMLLKSFNPFISPGEIITRDTSAKMRFLEVEDECYRYWLNTYKDPVLRKIQL